MSSSLKLCHSRSTRSFRPGKGYPSGEVGIHTCLLGLGPLSSAATHSYKMTGRSHALRGTLHGKVPAFPPEAALWLWPCDGSRDNTGHAQSCIQWCCVRAGYACACRETCANWVAVAANFDSLLSMYNVGALSHGCAGGDVVFSGTSTRSAPYGSTAQRSSRLHVSQAGL